MAETSRRAADALDPAVREAVIQQVFEVSDYFEVLVTEIDFAPDSRRPDRWWVLLGVDCELGSKSINFHFQPTAKGLSETPAILRQFLGDWTR